MRETIVEDMTGVCRNDLSYLCKPPKGGGVKNAIPIFLSVGWRRIMCTAKAIPESMAMSDAAKDAILRELGRGSSRPTELLATLGSDFTDFELKEAMLRLLHEGRVVMTSDRRLELAEAA